MLRPNYTSRFKKDVKRLKKKHIDQAYFQRTGSHDELFA